MDAKKIIFGLLVILVGSALLFDNLKVPGGDIPGDYWPVLLIAVGFFGWVGRLGKNLLPGFGSVMMMALGGILLAQNLIDDKSFVDLWPVLAIAVGVSIIFGHRPGKHHKRGVGMKFQGRGKRWNKSCWGSSSSDAGELFSGGGREVEGEYTGSTARVKLASEGIDLSRATLPEDGATLRLDITLGEYKIRVPGDWKLDIQADLTMAEIEVNRPDSEEERTGPTLTIGGKVFMGGVEISG